MALNSLPAQTPLVPAASFLAFDMLYRHVGDLTASVREIVGVRAEQNQFRSNTAVLAADKLFQFPLPANKKVYLKGWFAVTGNFKWRHIGPAGASLILLQRDSTQENSYSAADLTVAVPSIIQLEGLITNGATDGVFSISWAQTASSATPSGFYAGSVLSHSYLAS